MSRYYYIEKMSMDQDFWDALYMNKLDVDIVFTSASLFQSII